ncbi:glycosyl transferase family 90 [uncultured Sutterella sp.]|uniref:glycosyl transferase family 90 n=1 Tax=uncultured Sutterella sp. TaxID=286133 RepID=UPI0025D3B175|nr:glycosyl transferase family 90 [uncultured Sutterella sp.]
MPIRIELDKIHLKPRGKNSHTWYQVSYLGKALVPERWLLGRRRALLAGWETRADADLIRERVDYYCRVDQPFGLAKGARTVESMRWRRGNYNHDLYEVLRYFPHDLRFNAVFGDNTTVPAEPSFVKSRPIEGDVRNCVLMKLDKLRHFIFLKDRRSFTEKSDAAVFRGNCSQEHRVRFMTRWYGHPLVGCGHTGKTPNPDHPEWSVRQITPYDHLRYKFVLALEGNDVASNLKWVMSSNSIAVMPKPRYETWFMEGRLEAGRHYIEIRDDFEDLEEKIRWYAAHPEACAEIRRNAHAWVDQFRNSERELLIGLLTARKYFEFLRTGG